MQQLYVNFYGVLYVLFFLFFALKFAKLFPHFCVLFLCRYGVFFCLCVPKAQGTYHMHISCIITLRLRCLLACSSAWHECMHACMFAASSYITYINLSENIPLSWFIHCTWISYNNKRNEWEKRRKTAHLWIIHESLNKIFQIHFTKCVHFIVLMHLAGCYELHTRLSFFGSCCFSTSFAAFVAHAAKKLL